MLVLSGKQKLQWLWHYLCSLNFFQNNRIFLKLRLSVMDHIFRFLFALFGVKSYILITLPNWISACLYFSWVIFCVCSAFPKAYPSEPQYIINPCFIMFCFLLHVCSFVPKTLFKIKYVCILWTFCKLFKNSELICKRLTSSKLKNIRYLRINTIIICHSWEQTYFCLALSCLNVCMYAFDFVYLFGDGTWYIVIL